MSEAGVNKITRILNEQFSPNNLDVIDESHKHIGHQGNRGGGHYKIKIISSHFKDLSSIQKHRLIYQALTELFPDEIHALSIDAKSEP